MVLIALTTTIVEVEVVVRDTFLFNAHAGSVYHVPCEERVVTVLHLVPASAVIISFWIPPDELAGCACVWTWLQVSVDYCN